MKANLLIGLLLLVSVFCVFLPAEEITRGDFAIKLVDSMGLSGRLPESATAQDCINLLRQEGIRIPAEYDTSKAISVEEKADLLSQALTADRRKREEGRVTMESYRNKAVVIEITGEVKVKPEGSNEWLPAKVDMELTQGAYIKTGEGANAHLRVGVVGRVIVKENTEVLLQTLTTQADKKSEKDKKSENILLYLAMGEVFVDVRDLEQGSKFETQTPTSLAAVRGTTYIVKVEPVTGKTEMREAVR